MGKDSVMDRAQGSLSAREVAPHVVSPLMLERASRLPRWVHMGLMGWASPAWIGSVYDEVSPAERLASQGLKAYCAHPLLRTVSLERHAYVPYSTEDFSRIRAQLPQDYPCVVRAPLHWTNPTLRDRQGRALGPNPDFLNFEKAQASTITAPLSGLGPHFKVLMIEIGRFEPKDIDDAQARLAILEKVLAYLAQVREALPTSVIVGIEWRNQVFVTPRMLKGIYELNIVPIMGLHPSLRPALQQQRALQFYYRLHEDASLKASGPEPLTLPLTEGDEPEETEEERAARLDPLHRNWIRFTRPLLIRWSLSSVLAKPEVSGRSPTPPRMVRDLITRSLLALLLWQAAVSKVPAFFVVGNKAEGLASETLFAIAEELDRVRAKEVARADWEFGPLED